MNEDIFFYDFAFNLIYILPAYAAAGGYISVNCDKDFNGNGSLEIVFYDEELKRIIKGNPTEIFLKWGSFEGFITSYEFSEQQHRIMGMALNGLIHRAVIPTVLSVTNTVENIARGIITNNIPWLTLADRVGFTRNVTYSTDTYKPCDELFQDLFDTDGGGYEITADIKNKAFVFNAKKIKQNELILSAGNLNAYNFVSDFNGKEIAYNGWYKDSSDIWHKLTEQSKSGIYDISCVLSADNNADALKELKAKKAEKGITADIKSLKYGVDYEVGDIVRLQNDGTTQTKLISSVNIHQDDGYGATPTFKDLEE